MNADTADQQDELLRTDEVLAGIRLSGGVVRDGNPVDVTVSCGHPFLYPLRIALHRGLVKEADNGWVGRAAIAVHRILDSPPLRSSLTEHPEADWALAVPDVLFADVLATGDDPPPTAFRPATVDLPAKGFLEQVWLYVPGVAA
jgi:hypothetical protein